MYACKQCGTGNPLDSSFCKKCGTALPADELSEARARLAEMLDEGNNLFTEGRTDEAMLIAEAAVNANPSSHLAYSLKGLCHERLGQIAEALECYETAVGLNTDSSLDKVKVAALRNRLAQRVTEAPEPNRRSAAMIGVAAAVLFLVGGSLAAIGMSARRQPSCRYRPGTSRRSRPKRGRVPTVFKHRRHLELVELGEPALQAQPLILGVNFRAPPVICRLLTATAASLAATRSQSTSCRRDRSTTPL